MVLTVKLTVKQANKNAVLHNIQCKVRCFLYSSAVIENAYMFLLENLD